MPRVKRSVPARRRHKKILNLAKGFRMTHRTLFRPANEAVMHALEYAYRDRRARKRDMRKLWIARINAASRLRAELNFSVRGLDFWNHDLDWLIYRAAASSRRVEYRELVAAFGVRRQNKYHPCRHSLAPG